MHSHPLIFMRGVKANILSSLIDFIYCGETSLESDDVQDFLKLITELNMYPAQEDKTQENKTIKIINSSEPDSSEKTVNRDTCKFWNRGFCRDGSSVKCTITKKIVKNTQKMKFARMTIVTRDIDKLANIG